MSAGLPRIVEIGIEQHEAQIARLEARQRAAGERIRELEQEIDDARLRHRPTYPTEEQLAGIDAAIRLIAARTPNESHLGDPCGPDENTYVVSYALRNFAATPVDGGVIYVDHQAPYKKRGGGKLWGFTPADLDRIFARIDAGGFHVVESWEHDRGVSIVVRPA